MRVLFVAALSLSLAVIVIDRHGSAPASANPAYGSVKLSPPSAFIIQGYKFSVNVAATTCGNATTLSATLTSSATTATVVSTTGFLAAPASIWIDGEQIDYTGMTATTFTGLTRGAGGTTAAAHATNAKVNASADPMCHVAAYDIVINYDPTKFSVISDFGRATGGATTTTITDTSKAWKANQWVGNRITLTAGPGLGETRVVVSNTATTVTVSAWDPFPASQPSTSTWYAVGGLSDAGWIGTTGRPLSCPIGAQYGVGWAELHCITLGATPNGQIGTGNLVNLTLAAVSLPSTTLTASLTASATTAVVASTAGFPTSGTIWIDAEHIDYNGTTATSFTNLTRGVGAAAHASGVPVRASGGLSTFPFTLPPASPGTTILTIDSTTIPADVYSNGARRVTLCPDPNADGKVNSTDQLLMAQSFNKTVGQPGYTVQKDPDESGKINSTDMLIAAGEFNKKCIQL